MTMRTFLGSVRPTHVLALPVALLLLGSDCAATDDCYPFEAGDQLTVTLVEPYDEDSITRYRPGGVGDTGGVPSCEGFDGLMPEAAVDFRIDSKVEVPPQCEGYTATIEAGAPVPSSEEGIDPGGAIVALGTIVTPDGCTGTWTFDILPHTDNPFGEVVAGEEPPNLVRRRFETDAVDTCPMFPPDTGRYLCIDVFVATLEMR